MTSNSRGSDASGRRCPPANTTCLPNTTPVGGKATESGPDEAGKPGARPEGFIRVSDAKERFFGGAMSLRWWYRQIELGRLPHYRAGGAVLLRPVDVEAFVGEMFRGRVEPETGPEPPPPVPVLAPKSRSGSRRHGLRFFTD